MNLTNSLGINANRNLGKTANGKVASTARLSTGKRINSAKDDAAGLAISEKMISQIRGLNQADRNIADGVSAVNTMDGGMDGIVEILQRQRELTVQAINGTNTPEDKELIQLELDQLSREVTSMANKTHFNGIPLLNVEYGQQVETGYDGDFIEFSNKNPFRPNQLDKLDLDLISTENEEINVFFSNDIKFNVDGNTIDLNSFVFNGSTQTGENSYSCSYTYGNLTLSQNVTYRNEGGKSYADVTYGLKNNGSSSINVDALFTYDTDFGTVNPKYSLSGGQEVDNEGVFSGGDISNGISFCDELYPEFDMSVDYGSDVDEIFIGEYYHVDDFNYVPDGDTISDSGYSLIYNDTTINAGGTYNYRTSFSFVSESSENSGDLIIQCGSNGGQTMGITRYNCTAEKLGVANLQTDPYENAKKSLEDIDKAINKVSENRANAGAELNRLEFTQNSVQISSENLESSKSRVLDADMAKEMMALVKTGLLENSAIAMLAQSNQRSTENVQQLLK